jgi:hypothetical protein
LSDRPFHLLHLLLQVARFLRPAVLDGGWRFPVFQQRVGAGNVGV